ncbi:hypothetical protein HMPREF9372_0090 [Sporosarcina newyorkensis 2681]|uniref:Uncharacterized protein n=2 Tax=Sporosarcina newyorkensis TaxID=759851 RepID=A0A1T4XKT3_9BACL|nr:hypothetical protein HMPREF9372_0090 [Sporosarcina newyorkensis 2681]SKA89758.1 hypothetical protein SAMN04244570_0878 [Sporosarcina newyorkensis]
MDGSIFFAFLPILGLLFYMVPAIFIVWFLVKFIKIQDRRNDILQNIADKLDK